MLGPTFHMENRQQITISDFHHALRNEWDNINIVTGSDEEPGMRNSMKQEFPDR